MGVAIWRFLRTSDRRFAFFPAAHFHRFFRWEEKLPADVPGEAVIVELAVELKQRRPVHLLRTIWSKYRIDHADMWDDAHKNSALRDMFRLRGARRKNLFADGPPPVDLLVEEIHIRTSHYWAPSVCDPDSLCEAVNRRVKRLVLAHDGKNLFSIGSPEQERP